MAKGKDLKFAEEQKLKKKAREAFTKGKHKKALYFFLELSALKPQDLRIKTRVGDLLLKLKRKAEAVTVYKSVAANYASQGMLIQAIAVNKMILQIDCKNTGIRKELAVLYGKRRETPESPLLGRLSTVIQPIKIKEVLAKGVQSTDKGSISYHSISSQAISSQGAKPKEFPKPAEASPPAIEIEVDMDELLGEDEEELEISGRMIEFSDAVDLGELAEISLPPTPLFSDLEDTELEKVLSSLKRRDVKPQEEVCKEGASGGSIFIISEGSLSVSSHDSSGNKLNLATLKEGDFFGEFGYFSDHRRHATVTSLEESVVLEFKHQDMEKIIQEVPRVKEVLQKFYRQRLLETLLLKSRIFSHLSAGERNELAKRFEVKEYAKETLIMKEGDIGDSMYLIQEGKLQVSTKNKAGKSLLLAVLKEGDFCGEFSILTGAKRTANVVSMVDSKLLRLSKESVQDFLLENRQVASVLKKIADERVEGTIKVLAAEDKPSVTFEYDEVRSTMV